MGSTFIFLSGRAACCRLLVRQILVEEDPDELHFPAFVESVLEEQELARRVDVGSLAALRVPRVADLDALLRVAVRMEVEVQAVRASREDEVDSAMYSMLFGASFKPSVRK